MTNESFSIFTNAFWVLKASYHSTRAEIIDLVEDAEFEEAHDQEVIQRSQQALISPNARLDQELAWLPELSENQLRQLRPLLEAGQTAELQDAINFFPDVPKANVLAHLCGGVAATSTLLQNLLRCWDDIDEDNILTFLNSSRKISGFPEVTAAQLQSAIERLETAHAFSAALAIWRLDEPGKLMEQLVEEELQKGRISYFLTRFVRAYDNLSEPKLSQIATAIDAQVEIARQENADLASVTSQIADLLRQWDDVNQPVQVFEQHQGHEEGRSKRIYEKVRSLCIELANDKGEFGYAKRLSEALLHTFPELESVAEVLKDDVATLEDLNKQQEQLSALAPLRKACETAKSQISSLKSALQKSEFSQPKRGILKEISDAFDAAARTPGIGDAAILIVRDLALFVNNDRKDPETAFRLVDWLVKNRRANPSQETRRKLEEELGVLHNNWKADQLKRQSGDLAAMSKTIEEMLKYAKGDDRAGLLKLQSRVQREQAGKKVKWFIYAAIAAVIGYFVAAGMDQQTSRTSYQPTTTFQPSTTRPSTASSSSSSFAESRPPVGQGLVFNRSQVRYCVFQDERLDAMRRMATTNYQIGRFNNLVDDYNSRCSNFRYTSGVLSSVRREAIEKSAELAAEARRIVNSW